MVTGAPAESPRFPAAGGRRGLSVATASFMLASLVTFHTTLYDGIVVPSAWSFVATSANPLHWPDIIGRCDCRGAPAAQYSHNSLNSIVAGPRAERPPAQGPCEYLSFIAGQSDGLDRLCHALHPLCLLRCIELEYAQHVAKRAALLFPHQAPSLCNQ